MGSRHYDRSMNRHFDAGVLHQNDSLRPYRSCSECSIEYNTRFGCHWPSAADQLCRDGPAISDAVVRVHCKCSRQLLVCRAHLQRHVDNRMPLNLPCDECLSTLRAETLSNIDTFSNIGSERSSGGSTGGGSLEGSFTRNGGQVTDWAQGTWQDRPNPDGAATTTEQDSNWSSHGWDQRQWRSYPDSEEVQRWREWGWIDYGDRPCSEAKRVAEPEEALGNIAGLEAHLHQHKLASLHQLQRAAEWVKENRASCLQDLLDHQKSLRASICLDQSDSLKFETAVKVTLDNIETIQEAVEKVLLQQGKAKPSMWLSLDAIVKFADEKDLESRLQLCGWSLRQMLEIAVGTLHKSRFHVETLQSGLHARCARFSSQGKEQRVAKPKIAREAPESVRKEEYTSHFPAGPVAEELRAHRPWQSDVDNYSQRS